MGCFSYHPDLFLIKSRSLLIPSKESQCECFRLVVIGVQLFCSAALVSPVEQSESARHTPPLVWISFPLSCPRALSSVPWAVHWVLISYVFYSECQSCIYVHPNLPIHLTPPPVLVSIHLLSLSCEVVFNAKCFPSTSGICPFNKNSLVPTVVTALAGFPGYSVLASVQMWSLSLRSLWSRLRLG